jgi:hypothetical protein
MRYAILIYGDEARVEATPDGMKAMFDEYQGYERWLAGRGIKRGAEALYPTDQATTLRVREGKVMTIDGPFAETKEQLGGLYLLECEHLDEALEAARACPGSRHGSVEVRPVVDLSTFEGRP